MEDGFDPDFLLLLSHMYWFLVVKYSKLQKWYSYFCYTSAIRKVINLVSDLMLLFQIKSTKDIFWTCMMIQNERKIYKNKISW